MMSCIIRAAGWFWPGQEASRISVPLQQFLFGPPPSAGPKTAQPANLDTTEATTDLNKKGTMLRSAALLLACAAAAHAFTASPMSARCVSFNILTERNEKCVKNLSVHWHRNL